MRRPGRGDTLPTAAVAAAAVGLVALPGLPADLALHEGRSRPGTVTITSVSSGRAGGVLGDVVVDGRTLTDVRLYGYRGPAVGDSYPTRYVTTPTATRGYAPGHDDLVVSVAGSAVGAAGLACWAWQAITRLAGLVTRGRRRRARQDRRSGDPARRAAGRNAVEPGERHR